MGHDRSLALAMAAGVALGACGSGKNESSTSKAPGTHDDAGNEDANVAGDGAGEDSAGTVYPAFAVDAPQIQKNQGAVLSSPVVVTVTWPGDTNASTWEDFGDTIGASSYWTATTAPYGVGAATSGPSNHVRMVQPLPSSLSYDDIENLVIDMVQAAQSGRGAPAAGSLEDSSADDSSPNDGSLDASLDGSLDASPDGSPDAGSLNGSPDAGSLNGSPDAGSLNGSPNPLWPLPTLDPSGHSQTIYSLFIPPSTTETDPGTGSSFCSEASFGYHDVVTVGATSVVFTVVLECPMQTAADFEESAAHEDIEAATDPYIGSTTQGYKGFDANHAAWEIYAQYGDELADACQNWEDSYYQESASFPYWVQRSWSNTAALAGNDPCVPAPAGPYHGMTLFPSQESTVMVDQSALGGPVTDTQGFKAALGQPFTFQVGYFSNASTAPWPISYNFPGYLVSMVGGIVRNGAANVTIDKTSGQNGDRADVTVTVTERAPSGFHVMAVTWDPPTSSGYQPHYLPLVIVDE